MKKSLGGIKYILKILVFNTYMFLCALYIRIFRIKHLLFMAPFHENLGDHAITLSEQQFLEERGIRPFEVYTKAFDYCGKFFAKMMPSDMVIYVCGGGFLGSLWKHEERRVRKIIEFFPTNKIVIFPQTVTFADNDAKDKSFFEESKRMYSMNKNLILFVREERSYKYMKEKMPEVTVKKAPDIVTRLKVDEKKLKREGIIICFRKDKEKKVTDEMKEEVLSLVKNKYGKEKITYTDTVIAYMVNKRARKKEVSAKLDQFAGSKLVITDRLHGMIMAAITNTPCIAFSNSNGKVRDVYAWIKNNDFVKFVESMDQFEAALENLDLDMEYRYHIDSSLFYELSEAVK